ncbi:MAG TPA: gluconate 2-dehydrogenase subunit 3 family protein [Bryobacteraceae bacterium]|nr:gluconate 2-dehydrogenase subunit 3 family protein [Bryobacteraceae bacterium]
MSVDRRDLIRIVGAGMLAPAANAQHEHRTPTHRVGDYQPRVLTKTDYETLRRMLDVLLPADEASASAWEAGVGMYIDTTLKYGDDAVRSTWTSGLARYAGLSSADTETRMTELARKELNPSSDDERFFGIFKRAAIDAYCLSDAGKKCFGYKGDIAIRDFPGCTHPEHK